MNRRFGCHSQSFGPTRSLTRLIQHTLGESINCWFSSLSRHFSTESDTVSNGESDSEKCDEFVSSRPQTHYCPQTTHSPNFLGLHQNVGVWKNTDYGKGVIIAVIDSGISPDHPSFSDEGMLPPPTKWKGKYEFGASVCNKKLVGAKCIVKGIETPVDYDGHGTHVASIAAGNFVPGADFFGQAKGTAAGMAPLAHLAIYKAGCEIIDETLYDLTDILSAMEEAVEDGADILSLSLGKSVIPYPYDPISIGAFKAVEKGVLVVCSAGNRGPSQGTVGNVAPWILTVGASSISRKFEVKIVLSDKVIYGQTLFHPNNFLARPLPLIYEEKSDPSCDVEGKIVVFDMDGSLPKKLTAIEDSRAVAVILVQDKLHGLVISDLEDLTLFPAAQINFEDGLKIKEYIKSSSAPVAALLFTGTVIGDGDAPFVASFSSRGPSPLGRGILKPDIIGPGVHILGAWPDFMEANRSTFNILSGTSMSTAHLSGVAALIKSAHPDWSPAAIKSAIMTTADVLNISHSSIKDEKLEAANVFATGAGHVNPSKAIEPGLVYEIEPQHYIHYLYGLGYTDRQVALVKRDNVLCSEKFCMSEGELNYPSFSITFGEETQTYTRTLTNVGEANSLYVVEICHPQGVYVTVEPAELHFREKNQRVTYSITFKRLPFASNIEFIQGSITWTSSIYSVRSPIAAIMLN